MTNQEPKTFVEYDLEDALIKYIKKSKDFKLLVESLKEENRPVDSVQIKCGYETRNPEEQFDIEKCVTDSSTKAFTRKPIPIPSKTKRKKLKHDMQGFDGDKKLSKVIYEDIE